jgi:hypothetical protein
MEQEKQPEELTWWKIVLVLIVLVGVPVLIWNSIDFSDSTIETAEVVAECLDASQELVVRLNDGLNINGGGSLTNVKAVKSNDFANAYFVSGELYGPGLEEEGDIATFLTNKLDGTGPTFTADNVATEFSDYPNITTTTLLGEGLTIGMLILSHGYEESRGCVRGS